jgi:hypothetical protein
MNWSTMFLAVVVVAAVLACVTRQREPLAAESSGVSEAANGTCNTGPTYDAVPVQRQR